ELGEVLARLAVALERVLRPEAVELLALQLRDLLALRERLRHRLAVHLRQLRLVVERFQVRRTAGHVELDDALDLLRVGEGMDDSCPVPAYPRASRLPLPAREGVGGGPVGVGCRGLGEERRVEQRGERDAAEAGGAVPQEGSPVQMS